MASNSIFYRFSSALIPTVAFGLESIAISIDCFAKTNEYMLNMSVKEGSNL